MLGINEPSVTIKNIENAIIDHGYEHGWVRPQLPRYRLETKVAVIGSGPSGLACAAQLNKVNNAYSGTQLNENFMGCHFHFSLNLFHGGGIKN